MRKSKAEEWKSIFWTVALILFLRGFVAEPFKIPSGSMIPTLLIGDHLFVAKSSYDIGIPFTDIKVLHVSDPRRGDVIVFEYPNHEENREKDGQYYIKRLIGLPGDRIVVKGGYPEVVGRAQTEEKAFEVSSDSIAGLPGYTHDPNRALYLETLPDLGYAHWVRRYPAYIPDLPLAKSALKARTGKECAEMGKTIFDPFNPPPTLLNEICEFEVPPNMYFMMGDNRDESSDGREWGLVPRKALKGRALFIWMSFGGGSGGDTRSDGSTTKPEPFIRWSRLGLGIK